MLDEGGLRLRARKSGKQTVVPVDAETIPGLAAPPDAVRDPYGS